MGSYGIVVWVGAFQALTSLRRFVMYLYDGLGLDTPVDYDDDYDDDVSQDCE